MLSTKTAQPRHPAAQTEAPQPLMSEPGVQTHQARAQEAWVCGDQRWQLQHSSDEDCIVQYETKWKCCFCH